MATLLKKQVRRELILSNDHGKYAGKPINVSLLPGDVIEFQIKGTQQKFDCSLHYVLQLAKLMTWERVFQEKMKVYVQKKKQGLKCKRPKRIQPPYDKLIYKAAS